MAAARVGRRVRRLTRESAGSGAFSAVMPDGSTNATVNDRSPASS